MARLSRLVCAENYSRDQQRKRRQIPYRPLSGGKARDADARPIKTFRPERRPRRSVGSYGKMALARCPDTKISANRKLIGDLMLIIYYSTIIMINKETTD